MLIGQHGDQDEREKRIQKSQLYKEILDNQVRFNQQYRKGQIDKIRDKHYQTNNEHTYAPDNKSNHNDSIIREIEERQSRKKSRFLPIIKDSNIFIRGSSRFLKVQQPTKPTHKIGRTYTQQIEQEEESDEPDPYQSTCERIIKELQNIQTKPVKFRMRRKLYDMTEIHASKRNHLRNHSNQQPASNQYEQQPNKEHISYKSIKPTLQSQSENRYSSFVAPQIKQDKMPKITKEELNQFNNSFIEEKTNEKSKRSPSQNQPQQIPSTIKSKNAIKTQVDLPHQTPSTFKSKNTIKAQVDQSSSKKYNVDSTKREQTPALQKNTKQKLNHSTNLQHSSSRMRVNSDQSRLAQSSNNNSQFSHHLQKQRQNFLQILRKVKNRGESLKLKLAKYPHDKVNQEQQ